MEAARLMRFPFDGSPGRRAQRLSATQCFQDIRRQKLSRRMAPKAPVTTNRFGGGFDPQAQHLLGPSIEDHAISGRESSLFKGLLRHLRALARI